MKFTSKALLVLAIILIGALLSSNIILKSEYDKIDKSDIYWNYHKILEQPFKYLKITGGNGTRIAFEQSQHYSVRVLNDWQRYHPELIKSSVKDDTLFIKFVFTSNNENEKYWMKGTTLVRIFSPELLSIEGFNTNFEMFKLKQKSIAVNMAGKSQFEVESMVPNMDSISIIQKDSASVEFEMSPDYNSNKREDVALDKGAQIHFGDKTIAPGIGLNDIKSDEAMSINSC